MSMTSEEAIKRLEEIQFNTHTFEDEKAMEIAIRAVRPVSKEQVEKLWRGEWFPVGDIAFYNRCSRCERMSIGKPAFCKNCGAPMTDDGVDIVMERLEALKDGK